MGSSWGPMPRRNAKNGDSSATTTPLQTPTASTDTASPALTQEPVTYCPLEKPCGERAHHLLHTDHDAWQMPPAPAREN